MAAARSLGCVTVVKARDSQDRLFQVEIKMQMYSNLPARVIYNWADIYSQQLKSGNDYGKLKADVFNLVNG